MASPTRSDAAAGAADTSTTGAAPRSVRQPAVAGRGLFYPADPVECAALARSYLRPAAAAAVACETAAAAVGGRVWRGAVVPHAGWVCSGAIAGEAIATLAAATGGPTCDAGAGPAAARPPDVVVVFGAIHTPLPAPAPAVLASYDAWREPGGDAAVAVDVGARLVERGGLFDVDDRFHRPEHAVEVELPLIQAAWPGVPVLPVEVPAVAEAADVGRQTAAQLAAAGLDAVFLASSDLTHYGPRYGFAPAGVGPGGLAWAKDNDRRLLDRVVALDEAGIVPEVRQRLNACGGGAIAAMLAACREWGASRAAVLRHANSVETLADVHPQPPTDAVGYAGVVVG